MIRPLSRHRSPGPLSSATDRRRQAALVTVSLILLCAGAVAQAEPVESPVEPWDVAAEHGPFTEHSFTVEEGTWMGLDLAPSGDHFVFELLGDIYELGLGGGAAKRLTTGAAWDGEPRYSPDGKTIVFSSDRGGNTNLWLMDADGARPRVLTREEDVRISDPAWVDGDWIVARRRSTDTSSIGSHELWLYHRLGGAGTQLTKSEQFHGAVEPAVSPDGRYIYFSGRVGRFSYNADPGSGIWQIIRFDRRHSQLRPLTGEFGGAIRPTPSPDGERLAILRDLRGKTVLELYDLRTGARRQVADWLDPDGQEGFAIAGLYPRMDWFDDNRHLLLSAGGTFWKLDTETGERDEIPFSAQVDLRIHEALRPQRSPVQDEVKARLLRWPTLSPDGRSVLFCALGSIWRKELDGGAPRRLTDAGGREYAPSWSPDGKRIAFVSWDDALGGAIQLIPARGGRARVITAPGAKYSNPSWSPDGKQLVALRGSGTHKRGNDLGWELWSDLVLVDLKSGEERVVTATAGSSRAARVRFSADGERLLFPEDRYPDPRAASVGALVSVNLDGSDRRDVLSVANATEIVPSPDGRYVAFRDQHHAWLATLPELPGETVKVLTEGGGTPGWRLSTDAGDWVDFSGDGRYVSWVYGPQLHRVELAELVRWEDERQEAARLKAEEQQEEGAEDETKDAGEAKDEDPRADLPPEQVFELDVRLPRAVPDGALAVTGARIITMEGAEVLEGATIVVRGDRIVAIGLDGSVAIPEDAYRVDGSGTTLIPGLIDVHAHLHFSALDVLPEQEWRYFANLAYGVTTVHDPSAFTDTVFSFGELVEAGLMTGPRVFSTGEILYGASGAFRSDIQSLDDARRHVRRMKQLGATSVKSYQQPRREQRQWIIEAARELDMLVVPEGGGDLAGNLGMVLDGHSSIEHSLPVAPLYDDVVQLFARSKTAYTPTLLVSYGGLFGENYFYAREDVWKNERLLTFTPQGVIDRRARRRMIAPEEDWWHDDVARGAAAIQRAGGLVTLGAHGQLQGLGAHWELWALAGEGAMSPHEALRSATLNGAVLLGMDKDLGSLAVGKLADFVVLERNPLDAIENSDSVRLVVKNGELFDAATMDRLWPAPRARPPLLMDAGPQREQ